jgi:hypothetical protein
MYSNVDIEIGYRIFLKTCFVIGLVCFLVLPI